MANQKLPDKWAPLGIERIVFNLPMVGSIDIQKERRRLGNTVPDDVLLWDLNNRMRHFGKLGCVTRVTPTLRQAWESGKNPGFRADYFKVDGPYTRTRVGSEFYQGDTRNI